jgi:prepilin peptidase CpaA
LANVPLFFAAVVTAIAAFTDWRTGRIPNWLTLGAAVGGLGLRLFPLLLSRAYGQLPVALGVALIGAVLCSVIPLLLFWKGGMGGGDVKLFAALGIICSPELGLLAQTYTFVVALVLAPAWLLYHGTLARTVTQSFALLSNPFRRREKRVPLAVEDLAWFRLGPAIFVGTVLAVSRAALLVQ